jgi:hypothetical protein
VGESPSGQVGDDSWHEPNAATGQTILALAHNLSLLGSLEYIPLSGEIDLNRPELVVVCGPKTSPVTAAALQADPVLDFNQLTDGHWAIIERSSGKVHHRRFRSRPHQVATIEAPRRRDGRS